jgi:hypothetical protein
MIVATLIRRPTPVSRFMGFEEMIMAFEPLPRLHRLGETFTFSPAFMVFEEIIGQSAGPTWE